MTLANTDTAFIELLSAGLDKEVQSTLTENYITEKVKLFEEELRETIKPIVESISTKKIEQIRDYMEMTDKVMVMFNWKEV